MLGLNTDCQFSLPWRPTVLEMLNVSGIQGSVRITCIVEQISDRSLGDASMTFGISILQSSLSKQIPLATQ